MMGAAGARGELNQGWMRGDSALKGAMLSVLLKGPCHGYALARRLNRLLGPTWGIEAKSLYPRLDQLEREGLLVGRRGNGRKHDPNGLRHPALYSRLRRAMRSS